MKTSHDNPKGSGEYSGIKLRRAGVLPTVATFALGLLFVALYMCAVAIIKAVL